MTAQPFDHVVIAPDALARIFRERLAEDAKKMDRELATGAYLATQAIIFDVASYLGEISEIDEVAFLDECGYEV